MLKTNLAKPDRGHVAGPARPELKIVLAVFALAAAVFAISLFFVPSVLLMAQAGILFVVGLVAFSGTSKTAKPATGGDIERIELKSILFALEDALLVYDKNFKAVFFNPAAERLFRLDTNVVRDHQFQPQDAENPAWKLLTQIIFPSLAPSVVMRSASGEYPQVADLSFTDPPLELRVSTSQINDEETGLFGFMKIVRNRTREISLIKSKNEFLTVASHQLRTPVTEINWALESLGSDKNISEASRDILANAATASKNLLKIIEDLLRVAKIEEGHFGYNFENINIVEFINKILSGLVPIARKAGIKIYFDKPNISIPVVMADHNKLSMALTNILENAIRYNVSNGEVTVVISKLPKEPFLEVSVKDTGIGIAPEDFSRLFTKFFRAQSAMKAQAEGSGLGLYIAKNIIQAHGGRLSVESEPNRGSTFRFTIPTDPKLVPQHEVAIEE